MGRRIHAYPWAQSALGELATWPESLRAIVSLTLASRVPMFVLIGPKLVQLYNDPAIALMAGQDPHQALGLPFDVVWAEVWPVLGPMLTSVLADGTSALSENTLLPIVRNGRSEECYVTFAYAPIRDALGAISGVHVTATPTTEGVLAQRRLNTLRRLGQPSDAATLDAVCRRAAQTVAANPNDIPFAAFYRLEPDGAGALRVATSGIDAEFLLTPPTLSAQANGIADPLPFLPATGTITKLRLGPQYQPVPPGPWPERPPTALVLPLFAGTSTPAALLVAGVSSRIPLGSEYRQFFELVARQISDTLRSVQAAGSERPRAAAGVKRDRAKPTFFADESHEFRTPLTLMLGPLETVLAQDVALPGDVRREISVVARNALRLQKEANALLDLTRLSTGDINLDRRMLDVGELTRDIAAPFDKLMEQAGLHFDVDVQSGLYAAVDPQMWETIVGNLLSNAFKFTFSGRVGIGVEHGAENVVLRVSDTGTGIPAAGLARLFERFRRVPGARSRSPEGSGLGLALVAELVTLHGGSITVESQVDAGTTFTVSVPAGAATGGGDPSEVPLPAPVEPPVQRVDREVERPKVIVADDSADLREYITRLLAPHYDVLAVADGAAALRAARSVRPSLIVSDVIMPVMDGIALLRAVRADSRLRSLPVVLLSARSGEESAVEALDNGADDYVVKPFSAPQLLSRVRATIRTAQLRRDFERQHLVSESFQRASLPASLPRVPGMTFDAMYVPGTDGMNVGGDWYDALRLADGRLVVSIGDVAGSGLAAALTMGSVRQIFRGIAQVHADPALMLDAADRALRAEHPEIFVTAFVGVIDLVERTLTFASAGHPPPLLRQVDGSVHALPCGGLPLGLRGRPAEPAASFFIDDDAVLLLYTDGLTEASQDPIAGERELCRALSAIRPQPSLASRLYERLFDGRATKDDIAILALHVHAHGAPAPDHEMLTSWQFAASDGNAARAARGAFHTALVEHHLSADDVGNAEIVFGELVGNVARYAGGLVEIAVDWSGAAPVLHVMDRGPGFAYIPALPHDVLSESGRGLFIIAALTDQYAATRRVGGGSHARAVLCVQRHNLLQPLPLPLPQTSAT